MKTLKFISTLSMMLFVFLMGISQVQSAQTTKQTPQISATGENMLPATLQKTTDALTVANEGVLSSYVAIKDQTALLPYTKLQKTTNVVNNVEGMLMITTQKLKNVTCKMLITPKNLVSENSLKMKKAVLSQLPGNSKVNFAWNNTMIEKKTAAVMNLDLVFNNQTNFSGMAIIDPGVSSFTFSNNMMVNNATKTLLGLKLAFDSQTSVDPETASLLPSDMMITITTTRALENSNMLLSDLVKSMQPKQANSYSSFSMNFAYDTGTVLGAIYV